MTREEAIELLVHGDWIYSLCTGNKEIEKLQEAINIVCNTLRPVSREQVEKVWPGCNICKNVLFERIGIIEYEIYVGNPEFVDISDRFLYCPKCGKPLTDEAVQMVMERLEALYGEEN